jgi:hypothetical protein
LKINNPQIFANSFGKIYNIPILQKYIFNLEKEKRNRVLSIHVTKMRNLNLTIKHPILQKKIYDGDDENEINTNINELLNIYRDVCKSCFRSWYNTPGYYLLSEIDYNSYFKEIGLIKEKEHVDGVYVEVDQDEIVLFDTSLVKKEDTLFILPYSFINKPLIEKQDFIKKYIDLTKTFTESYHKRNIPPDLLKDFFNILSEFNMFNNNYWNFTWVDSGCLNFNSLENIEETCSPNINCTRSLNEDTYTIASIINNYWKKNNCKGVTYKLQLENMSEYNITELKKYIEFTKTNNDKNNIDLLTNVCTDAITISSTHRTS